MKMYLAARYSRREELCGYRDELAALGVTVTSRWLDGAHQISSDGMPLTDEGERRFEAGDPAADRLRGTFARHDLEDVLAADLLAAFTGPPRSSPSRGGQMVELGIALGARRAVAVIGPRENLFCWLPQAGWFAGWPQFRGWAASPGWSWAL